MIIEKPNIFGVAEFLASSDDHPTLKGKAVNEIVTTLTDRIVEETKDLDFSSWPKFDDIPLQLWRGVIGLIAPAASKNEPCIMIYVLLRDEEQRTEANFSEIEV